MSNLNAIQKIVSSTQDRSFQLLEESKGLVNKWAKTGLLEGVDSEYDRASISILLENQAKQLITESSRTGTAAGSEEWSGVALPLVRRIFSEIAAKDFVSVQPMSLPSGLVFYLDFKYGTTNQAGFATTNTAGALPSQPGYQTNSVFGVTSTTGDPSGGLYGAGRFGYSIATTASIGLQSGSGTTPTSTTFATASIVASDYNYDTRFLNTYSASLSAGTPSMYTVTVSSASIPNFDTEGVRAFNISSSTGIVTVFPQFTRVNSDNTAVTFVVSGSAQSLFRSSNTLTVFYELQPTAAGRGDFEAGGAGNGGGYSATGNATSIDTNINIPEINVEMRSEPIVAKTRKLKAIWTPEFAQDLNAYHAIDAEAELTSMLSEYISQEIDLEILDMLMQSAVTTDAWSAVIGRSVDISQTATLNMFPGTSGVADAATGAYYNQQTWFQTLGTKIQKVSNKIHQKTMRGGANFLVCSPDVATILESIPGYAADTNGDKMQFAMGVQKAGMMNNRFQVYKNPYMLENTILMGYRGNQFLETGAVYSPYVPLIMTPLVYDPNNFTPRKGVMTRYAKKIVRPEFYGVIRIMDLNRI
jgi:hypothetical protein